jgi:AcrR family transcriptional regulator
MTATEESERARDEGTGGQARTRLARGAVLEASRKLFLERGYAATTIGAISEACGVPAPTVYRLFTSKLGLLKTLIDQAVTGDDDTTPLPQRPRVRSLLADPDPRRLLAGVAVLAREVNDREQGAYPILASAASSDPTAAGLLAAYNEQRQRGQGQIARSLARLGALRPGMSERDAADIIHAIVSPDLYRLLTRERGWSSDRFEHWLADTLAELLLGRRQSPQGE